MFSGGKKSPQSYTEILCLDDVYKDLLLKNKGLLNWDTLKPTIVGAFASEYDN